MTRTVFAGLAGGASMLSNFAGGASAQTGTIRDTTKPQRDVIPDCVPSTPPTVEQRADAIVLELEQDFHEAKMANASDREAIFASVALAIARHSIEPSSPESTSSTDHRASSPCVLPVMNH